MANQGLLALPDPVARALALEPAEIITRLGSFHQTLTKSFGTKNEATGDFDPKLLIPHETFTASSTDELIYQDHENFRLRRNDPLGRVAWDFSLEKGVPYVYKPNGHRVTAQERIRIDRTLPVLLKDSATFWHEIGNHVTFDSGTPAKVGRFEATLYRFRLSKQPLSTPAYQDPFTKESFFVKASLLTKADGEITVAHDLDVILTETANIQFRNEFDEQSAIAEIRWSRKMEGIGETHLVDSEAPQSESKSQMEPKEKRKH